MYVYACMALVYWRIRPRHPSGQWCQRRTLVYRIRLGGFSSQALYSRSVALS
jgi:hypothetical protein